MAKINAIKVDGITRYIETIAYKDTLPTATSDSADLVSVSNTLYIKQVTDGVYSYVELTAGSGGGLTEEEVTNLINSNEAVVTLTSDVRDLQVDKQDTLVSGTNIKTINNESLLGEGNIEIEGGGGPAITIVDTLPNANEENFEKGKIYTQGDLLQYISRVVLDEGTLSQVSSLPVSLYITSAAAVGSNIYIFGGYGSSAVNTIYQYSKTTDTVTTMSATLPVALQGTSAAAVGTDIYIFGGRDSNYNYVNTIYKYSTTTDTVTTMSATLPVGLCSTAAAVGTDIYILGGQSGSNSYVKTIYRYSTTTGLITMSATLPSKLSMNSAAAVGSDIYLFGGYSSIYVNTIYQYSTTTNIISKLETTLPVALHGTSAAAVGSDIYLFGGQSGNTSSSTKNTIYKYSTTTNTISTMSTTLPVKLTYTSAAAVGSDIYIFGGQSGNSAVNNIYKYALGYTYSYKDFPADIDNKQDTITSDTTLTLGSISAPDSLESSTYGTGTSGQVLKSNGNGGLYWADDINTNRTISVNGSTVNALSNTTTPVNFKAGDNVTLTASGADITIAATGGGAGLTEEEVNNLITSNETVVTLTSDIRDLQTDKQDTLVSGTNIKTVNGESILGEGNIEVADDTAYVEEKTLYISKSTSAEGTTVVANNGEETTDTLSTLKVGETNYAIPQGGGGSVEPQVLTGTMGVGPSITWQLIIPFVTGNMAVCSLSGKIIDEKNTIIILEEMGFELTYYKELNIFRGLIGEDEIFGTPFVHDDTQYIIITQGVPFLAKVPLTDSAIELTYTEGRFLYFLIKNNFIMGIENVLSDLANYTLPKTCGFSPLSSQDRFCATLSFADDNKLYIAEIYFNIVITKMANVSVKTYTLTPATTTE